MAITAIEGMQFRAFHGVHQEEGVVGNRFSVDVYFEHNFEGDSDDLRRCIDYEQVYERVAERMKRPVRLIEHLAHLIADDFRALWPEAQVRVRVSKYHPLPYGILERTYAEVVRPI